MLTKENFTAEHIRELQQNSKNASSWSASPALSWQTKKATPQRRPDGQPGNDPG